MTGFGKSIVENEGRRITVEIKSLNSKQLDMTVRVPAFFREVELELRNRIARRVERGKVDVVVTVESLDAAAPLSLNLPLLATYKEQLLEMSRTLGIPEPDDWYATLLRMPEAMVADSQADASGMELDLLYAACDEAVEALMQFRASEGAKLEDFFAVRVESISALLAEVPRYEAERVAKIRARIEENLPIW